MPTLRITLIACIPLVFTLLSPAACQAAPLLPRGSVSMSVGGYHQAASGTATCPSQSAVTSTMTLTVTSTAYVTATASGDTDGPAASGSPPASASTGTVPLPGGMAAPSNTGAAGAPGASTSIMVPAAPVPVSPPSTGYSAPGSVVESSKSPSIGGSASPSDGTGAATSSSESTSPGIITGESQGQNGPGSQPTPTGPGTVDTGTETGTGGSTGPGATTGAGTTTGTGATAGPSGTSSEGATNATVTNPSGSATPPPSSSGGSAAGKKGINFNDAALLGSFAGKASWAANWEQNLPASLPQGMAYYPMLWNDAPDRISRWDATAQAAIDRGDKVLFSFNEPIDSFCPGNPTGHQEQACMKPETAAEVWKTHMLPWAAKGANLIAPSFPQGEEGEAWINSFIASCPKETCQWSALSLHWYEGAHQISYFKEYINGWHDKHGDIWLTEFKPTAGTEAEKAAFYAEAVEWMDGQSWIKGYAAFMAEELAPGGTLNADGGAYAAA